MALTRDFKETVQARVKRDAAFRKALLREAIESFLSGDVETGKAVLRDFINATVGFTKLGQAMHRSPKSLMRMLGPTGNPHAKNLSGYSRVKTVWLQCRAEVLRHPAARCAPGPWAKPPTD